MRRVWLRFLVNAAAILPFVLLVLDFARAQLGANPVQALQLRTGLIAINLLVGSLACRPVYTLTGRGEFLWMRRTLGLYAFAYACLHLLNFIGLDYRFDFGLMWADSANKRYIFAGLAALLVMLPLAITSTRGWRERLGENWGRLHRLLYVAALLAALHFFWQTKADFRLPLWYAGLILLLLAWRLLPLGRNRP